MKKIQKNLKTIFVYVNLREKKIITPYNTYRKIFILFLYCNVVVMTMNSNNLAYLKLYSNVAKIIAMGE